MAVPGEVAGYWAARRKYGNKEISWQRILQPTINLCRRGIPVTASLASVLREKGPDFSDPGMVSVFVNPETGDVWQERYPAFSLAPITGPFSAWKPPDLCHKEPMRSKKYP